MPSSSIPDEDQNEKMIPDDDQSENQEPFQWTALSIAWAIGVFLIAGA